MVIEFKGRLGTLDALGRKRDARGTVFERTGTETGRSRDQYVSIAVQANIFLKLFDISRWVKSV